MNKLSNISPFVLLLVPIFAVLLSSAFVGNFNTKEHQTNSQKQESTSVFVKTGSISIK